MTTSKFFTWIREARVYRSDKRWLGGVCAGIAERTGWDRALVRAIGLVMLLTGFGFLAYMIAWLLLPDARNQRIVAEELFSGGSTSEDVVVGILAVIAALVTTLTFWGWATIVLFFVVIDSWGRQARNTDYEFTMRGGYPQGQSYGSNGLNGSNAQTYAQASAQASAQEYQQPNAQPGEQANAPFNPVSAPVNQTAQFAAQAASPMNGSAQAIYAPRWEVRDRVTKKRRSGGVVLHLLVLAASVLSLAGVLMWALSGAVELSIIGWVTVIVFWVCSVTLLLGCVGLALALAGRRAGGYLGVSVLGVIISIIAALGFTLSAYTGPGQVAQYRHYSGPDVTSEYRNFNRIDITDAHTEVKLTKELADQLSSGGVLFASNDALGKHDVVLDLRNWKDVMGTHQWTNSQGFSKESACPTGDMKIATNAVNLDIIVPQGCTYSTHGVKVIWGVNQTDHDYVRDIWNATKHMSRDADDAYDHDDNYYDDIYDDDGHYDNPEFAKRIQKDIELRLHGSVTSGQLRVREMS